MRIRLLLKTDREIMSTSTIKRVLKIRKYAVLATFAVLVFMAIFLLISTIGGSAVLFGTSGLSITCRFLPVGFSTWAAISSNTLWNYPLAQILILQDGALRGLTAVTAESLSKLAVLASLAGVNFAMLAYYMQKMKCRVEIAKSSAGIGVASIGSVGSAQISALLGGCGCSWLVPASVAAGGSALAVFAEHSALLLGSGVAVLLANIYYMSRKIELLD